MKISVCVPCYEMRGRGVEYLTQLLDSASAQVGVDYEIIVSDDSKTNDIMIMTLDRKRWPRVRYFRNTGRKGSSANINNAIRHADGEIIKPMFQDDFFKRNNCLKEIVRSGASWGACGFCHTREGGVDRYKHMVPRYNSRMLEGVNTIGAPSVTFFKRDLGVFFDEELIWLMDCDFYYRLFCKDSRPVMIDEELIVVREWAGRITDSIVTPEIDQREKDYVRRKYDV